MSKEVLITRPEYDYTTRYISAWAEKVIDFARLKGTLLNEKRGHPLADKTAELFLEPSNQVAISLLKGRTVGEAQQNSKKSFLRNIQKLLTSESTPEDSSALRYLLWDMQHQVCLGNQSAVL